MSLQVIEKLKTDGVIVTLSSDQKINVTGDQKKVDYWLPEIAQHKQEIIEQLKRKNDSSCPSGGSDKASDLQTIRQWMLDGGRPSNDYLFRLIIEKCEKDEVARKRFVQEAQATKARLLSNAEAAKHPIVNEKVVRLVERDYRRYCNGCVFLDYNGRCKQWQKTNPPNPKYRPVPDVLRNCSLFKPRE